MVGCGVIASIGSSCDECFESLQGGHDGIKPLTTLDSVYRDVLPVGEVAMDNPELAERIGMRKPVTRTAMFAIHAAQEALKQSGLKKGNRWRTGLLSATTVGGMDRTEVFFPAFHRDRESGDLSDVVNHGCGATTDVVAAALGIHDFVTTINTACSSSVNSIIFGARLIRHGMLDVVVAGGTDALTKFTINGFRSLMILDDEPCRPFDADRKGLNLGEGSGFVVLVSDNVRRAESLTSRALLAGFANTNDAFHQTASSQEGRGSYAAMQLSLEMAGVPPSGIDYINLHGTGTLNNDQSEGAAIRRLFGEAPPAMSSTKAFTGHTLGACGGIEAVFSVMALEKQCVFPNLRFRSAMPDIHLEPQRHFSSRPNKYVMSNSFGFGGSCSSVIFALGA